MIRAASRIVFCCLLLFGPPTAWNFSSDSQRLLCGDYTFYLTLNGALSSLEKKGASPLRSPNALMALELTLGNTMLPLKKPVSVEKTADGVRFAYETESLPFLQIEIVYRISPG
jgi:hypothetical protein